LTSHFQDGGYDVISFKKLLPPGDKHEASATLLCSSVRQLLSASCLPSYCRYLFWIKVIETRTSGHVLRTLSVYSIFADIPRCVYTTCLDPHNFDPKNNKAE